MRTQADVESSSAGRDEERRPAGLEREVADLRKEVIEARNLVIKTDNLLKNLHAELKVVSKRNDDSYKRTWFASAAAYGIFLVLAIAGAVFASRASVATERAQVETARAEADLARRASEQATAQLAKLKTEQETLRSSSEKANAAYRMMSEGDGESRLRGIDELAKLDRKSLSLLEQKALDDRARVLKVELGQAAFERGRAAFRRNDMKTTASELRRYLALGADGGDAVMASYYLGAALYEIKEFAEAVPHLDNFTTKGRGQKNVDYAYLLLGQALEQTGNHTRAAEIYRKALSEYPGSEYAVQMQARYKVANRGVAQGGEPVVPVAPAPAAVQPRPAAAAPVAPAAAQPVPGGVAPQPATH